MRSARVGRSHYRGTAHFTVQGLQHGSTRYISQAGFQIKPSLLVQDPTLAQSLLAHDMETPSSAGSRQLFSDTDCRTQAPQSLGSGDRRKSTGVPRRFRSRTPRGGKYCSLCGFESRYPPCLSGISGKVRLQPVGWIHEPCIRQGPSSQVLSLLLLERQSKHPAWECPPETGPSPPTRQPQISRWSLDLRTVPPS